MDDIDRRIDRILASIEADRARIEEDRKAHEARIEADRKAHEARIEADRKAHEAISAKFDKDMQELRASQAETERILRESILAADKRKAEEDLRRAEEAKQRAEEEKRRKAINDDLFSNLKKEIGGISNSNGEFAEEYFENVFCKDMSFAGMHFHEFLRRKKFDDRKRRDEFDIIMLNEKNVLIVETKYKAQESDINEIIKKAESFRYWYPEHKNHDIYFCLASLRFEDNIINRARKKGIAIAQQLGDKTVVNDKNLKAY